MEDLIPIINQLQEVFSTSGSGSGIIQLPQIVVVGEQSAGKSSVLESLVGRTCLPRGKGIVTRCPIVLQLMQYQDKHLTESIGATGNEFCVFPHLPGEDKIINEFDEIINIINAEVDRRAGTNKGIVNTELIMKIYSPNVVNLTVVDLPGLVKNPTGDQPADIEKQIEDLIRIYISNPNSIILAVSAATNDIATSWSLKLAKEVDPDLDRTVAVVTKLDLMDHGTNATEVLMGDVLSVQLGIVGVVNRSFEDIKNKKTIADSIEHEAKFLSDNYPIIASRNGSPFLKAKLQALLLEHIQKCLPQLQARIGTLKNRAAEEMTILGEDAPVDKSLHLRKIIEKFSETFKAAITGRKFRNIERRSLIGVAKLKKIFEDELASKLDTVDPLADMKVEHIFNTVANSRALESGIVVTEVAFQDLLREQIELLIQPTLDCAMAVHEEMLAILDVCMKSLEVEMSRFPKVKSAICGVVTNLLQERQEISQAELKKYVEYHSSFITMDQTDFNDEMRESQDLDKIEDESEGMSNLFNPKSSTKGAKSPPRPQQLKFQTMSKGHWAQTPSPTALPEELSETELARCELMRKLVSKYFEIVKSDIRKFWPKVMYKTLIYFMEQEIHDKLIDKLYKEERIEQLVTEDVRTAERRQQVHKQLQELQKANKILAVIRDKTL